MESKTKHTYTIETDSLDELSDILNAPKYSYILFHLRHNFWRKWKHSDGDASYLKGVYEVLDELQKYLDEEDIKPK